MQYQVDLDAVRDSMYALDAMRYARNTVERMCELAELTQDAREPWMLSMAASLAVDHLITCLIDPRELRKPVMPDPMLNASVQALRTFYATDTYDPQHNVFQCHTCGRLDNGACITDDDGETHHHECLNNGAQLSIFDALDGAS